MDRNTQWNKFEKLKSNSTTQIKTNIKSWFDLHQHSIWLSKNISAWTIPNESLIFKTSYKCKSWLLIHIDLHLYKIERKYESYVTYKTSLYRNIRITIIA